MQVLFSEREIDALRLLSWCQFVLHNELLSILPAAEFESLVSVGFIKFNDSTGAFVITAKGTRALTLALDGQLPTITQTYHAKAIERRLRLSRLMLTAYKAGIKIFPAPAGPSIVTTSIGIERS